MKSLVMNRIHNKEFVLIAEIGVNYYDIAKKMNITPLEAAKMMILEAKKSGIHAVKFQSYKASNLASVDSPYYWDLGEEKTTSQFELFQKYDKFEKKDYAILSKFCQDNSIEFLSTAFDYESADYLESMMNLYKISSSDINNHPFIEYQAKKNKPIIISTGASNEKEIDEAIRIIRKHNNKEIVVMHCVLEYPTPYSNANLNKIKSLKSKYSNLIIGYSDHTKPDPEMVVLQTAFNFGAMVIEKHFTLDKSIPGNDHYHSMNPKDAIKILNSIKLIEQIKGKKGFIINKTEIKSRENARRSIVSKREINLGEEISMDMITFKRPGKGKTPSHYKSVIAKKAKTKIKRDQIITFVM